jgi:hypothetical protein
VSDLPPIPAPTVAEDTAALDVRLVAELGRRRRAARAAEEDALERTLDELERLERAGGRRRLTLAGDLVGVHRDTLRAKLRQRRADRKDP